MKNEKKVFSKIGLALAITTLAVGTIEGFLSAFIEDKLPSLASSPWISYILQIVFYVVGIPLFFGMVKGVPDSPKKEKKKLSVKQVLILFCITYAVMIITNIFTMVLMYIVSLIKGGAVINPLTNIIGKSSMLGAFIFAGILSPIVEETLFRGIMLNKLKCYGDKIAIITTAVLFGLFHANFSQFFYATAIGLVFAYVAIKTGTIKYTIILHIMVNIMGVLGTLSSKNMKMEVVVSIFAYIFAILGVILFFIRRKDIRLSPAEVHIEDEHVFKITCVNFGMIFNFIISMYSMIILLLK